jgi:hypothetical protein
MTTETQVTKLSIAELTALVLELQARIVALETPKATNTSQREMTDDDARRILNGDLKDMKHKEAGEKLGLSYGQIYSCRLGYTFKAIHKELGAIAGYKNSWIK